MRLSDLLVQLRAEREALERAVGELRGIAGDGPPQPQPVVTSPSVDYEANQQRLEEYKFLRVELEAIWSQTYSTLNFILAVIGLIITAAYGTRGDPVVLLPMASIVTFGAYMLIRIHNMRVWRIVGYMRRALEAKLKGIRWETRLAARHAALRADKANFDCNIFDGHVLILDAVNVALLVGIFCSRFASSEIVRNFGSETVKAWVLVGGCSLVPLGILIWSFRSRKSLKRGESMETEHLDSWGRPSVNGPPVYEAEPPREWKT